MATTTTHYGFDIPQSTDLVKDGATAIATLGQDIDTAMNTALGTNKAGMVLLNTTSFSAVSSQSINDVFSATYDNYKIVLNAIGSTAINIALRFRVSGSDVSTSTYQINFLFASDTTVSSGRQLTNTSLNLGDCGSSDRLALTADIHNPFLSVPTGVATYGMGNYPSANNLSIKSASQSGSTSFTGFTLLPNTGNITGNVSVYGYNK